MTEQIKILFLTACPKDISRIRLDQEVREVDGIIRKGEYREQLELIHHTAVRPADVREALLRHKPHILHFSGHGSATEGIVVEDATGNTNFLGIEVLADLLGVIKDNLRVVVLNACYSAVQAEAIRQVVDFTIGMRNKIGDRSAIVFSVAFYEGLANGRNVRESFRLGLSALKFEKIPETETPALLEKEEDTAARTYLISPRERRHEEPPRDNLGTGGQVNVKKRDEYTNIIHGDVRTDLFHLGPKK